MQSLILSSLISTAFAANVIDKCTDTTNYVVVRCQATTVDALKKCYKTTQNAPTEFDDSSDDTTFCGKDVPANASATVISDKIGTEFCKQCFKKKFECPAGKEEKTCSITSGAAGTSTSWKADLQKCTQTLIARDETNNVDVRNIDVNTDYSIKCDVTGTTIAHAVGVIDAKNCKQCVATASPEKPASGLPCPAGKTIETCKVVEGKTEDNDKCFKKGTKGVTKCKKADKEECEKCAAAYVVLFLAFAALLL